MTLERWLVWADKVYFTAAIIAVIATSLTVVAGLAQYRLNARIADKKDRAFADFKLASETHAKELDARAAAAGTEAAKANERAAELETTNLKLQAQIEPRRLPAAALAMMEGLRKFGGSTVRVRSYSLDGEGAVFATQIMSVFNALHFKLQDERMSQGAFDSIAFGVRVTGSNTEFIKEILATFLMLGIAASSEPLPNTAGISITRTWDAEPDAVIFVGIKPVSL